VTATTITVTGVPFSPPGGLHNNTTVNRIVNHGLFTGNVTFAIDGSGHGTITRADNSSWLDDGFLEGQIFQIDGAGSFKIQALTGNNVQTLVVTAMGAIGLANGSYTFTQWAAEVTFTSGNWYVPVAIPVVADPHFNVPSSNTNQLFFPKVPHLLANIKGPLSVEGADPGNDHTTLQMAVQLPHETNALPSITKMNSARYSKAPEKKPDYQSTAPNRTKQPNYCNRWTTKLQPRSNSSNRQRRSSSPQFNKTLLSKRMTLPPSTRRTSNKNPFIALSKNERPPSNKP